MLHLRSHPAHLVFGSDLILRSCHEQVSWTPKKIKPCNITEFCLHPWLSIRARGIEIICVVCDDGCNILIEHLRRWNRASQLVHINQSPFHTRVKFLNRFFSNHRADTVSDYAEGVMHCVHHLRSVLSLIDDKVSVESWEFFRMTENISTAYAALWRVVVLQVFTERVHYWNELFVFSRVTGEKK